MIKTFCEKFGYPKEAEEQFSAVYEKVLADGAARSEIYDIMDTFFMGADESYIPKLDALAQRLGVRAMALYMVFFIMSEKAIEYIYNIKGYSGIYFDTVRDTYYKCEECFKMYGFWGTHCLGWFGNYAKCNLFALGRLQFQPYIAPWDKEGYVKAGDTVYAVHIPSGAPLRYENVLASLDEACTFFGKKEAVFSCHSWLLYPPQCEMYAPGSNLKKFAELFDIIESNDTNEDLWRVFMTPDCSDTSKLTATSSLSEKILARLKEGKTMGQGLGFIKYTPGIL